jgi:beta-glucosidase
MTNRPDVEARTAAIVADLTLDECVDLMTGDLPFWAGLIDMSTGGYHEHPFPSGAVERHGLEGLWFADGPRGCVVGEATCFPVTMARGATWDIDLEERIGDIIGVELRTHGATFTGAVCINLLRHPAWGRAQETYGEDPVLVGELGAALTRGLQRHVMACVKHYALNSMENARFTVDVTVDDRTLHEVYLPHFKRVIDEGVASVMSAYNAVNGQWCGHHTELLRAILKDDWGWDGFVITDFVFGMRDARLAIEGGLDVEMPFRNLYDQHLAQLVRDGAVDESLVRDAATRIVRQLLIQHERGDSQRYDSAVLASDGHRALAQEAARKSMTLLKNDGVLPLDPTKRIAVIGRLATMANTGDRGSSDVYPPHIITPAEGLIARLGDAVTVDDGTNAAAVAAAADIAVVIVGYTHADEGEFISDSMSPEVRAIFPPPDTDTSPMERVAHKATVPATKPQDAAFGGGGDRASLQLRDDDLALIDAVVAANPNTVVCVVCGSAVVMESWRHRVPAILMSWYAGMEGGHALADVLTGTHNPSGHLPFSIATDEAHYPFFDRDATAITYEYLHGYRKLVADRTAPAYPFGFGLSYTSFVFDQLSVTRTDDEITATCVVTNSGDFTGDDVIQVYASFPDAVVERPSVMLAGFERITLDPGATTSISVPVPLSRLAHYEPSSRSWIAPDTVEISVGHDVLDRPLAARV